MCTLMDQLNKLASLRQRLILTLVKGVLLLSIFSRYKFQVPVSIFSFIFLEGLILSFLVFEKKHARRVVDFARVEKAPT